MPVNLTADQVARRLGVQRATVYAYVSRGLLSRRMAADGRTSLFDPDEVEALARRGRPRRESVRSGTVEVVLTTAITAIDGPRLVLRGHDLAELAGWASFEVVAELLWSGEPGDGRPWHPPATLPVVEAAVAALPPDAPPATRLALAVTALAGADPGRGDLRPEAVRAKAGAMLAALPAVLPLLGEAPAGGGPSPTAAALWPRLSTARPTRARIEALNATLVALADHELATSTLAARVAASTRANPYACLLAAIGAVSGPLHGRAAVTTHRMVTDAVADGDPVGVVSRAIDEHGRVPGFGHPLYPGIDPRATLILAHVRRIAPAKVATAVDGLRTAALDATGQEPDVDFALGALAAAGRMPLGATEAVFTIGRTAGWTAHVLEEYGERPLRFRPRSIYTGPLPA